MHSGGLVLEGEEVETNVAVAVLHGHGVEGRSDSLDFAWAE